MQASRGWIRAFCEILLNLSPIIGHVSAAAAPLERSSTLGERALTDNIGPTYIDRELNDKATWLPTRLDHDVDGRYYPYREGQHVIGVRDLRGCTAVVIPSDKGVFVAHVYEIEIFQKGDRHETPQTPQDFLLRSFDELQYGNPSCRGLATLIGMDARPGPMHYSNHPEVHVITPGTIDSERRELHIHTELRYEQYARILAHHLNALVRGITPGGVVKGYIRGTIPAAGSRRGSNGRVFLEYDTNQSERRPRNPRGRQMLVREGKWRLWVGAEHDEDDSRIFPWRTTEDRSAAGSSSGSRNPQT
ncbi:MAG: hypothetical protein M1820_005617 [Bogoriella megaspora]|nr:MAG: hypothetical protein M1820_005617 [Bogoriella megaspora]